MTDLVYATARNLHLVLGSVALVTFWLQMARGKGGASHRRWGFVYFGAMAGVLITALPMIGIALRRGQTVGGLFLGFLTLITVAAGIDAVRASRHRDSGAWIRDPLSVGTTVLIALYSALLVVLYLRVHAGILLLMAAVGAAGVVEAMLKMRRGRPYVWWVEHVSAVLATGIAVHIAFLSFGLRGLTGVGGFSVWAFLVPIVAAQFFAAYFHRRFAGGAERARERALEKGFVV